MAFVVSFGSFGDILSCIELIANVVSAFRENGGLVDKWSADMNFALTLRSTLHRLTHLAETTPNKSYSRDLTILIQGIHRPIMSFYNFLNKYKQSLESAASPSTYHKVKASIGLSLSNIFGKVEDLRKDTDRQLQSINSLLMLYTIDNLTSQPSQKISQDQLSDLESAMKLANAPLVHQFNELARLASDIRPNSQTQQQCLLAMRSDAQQNHIQLQREFQETAKAQSQAANRRHHEQMYAWQNTNTQVSRVAQSSQMQLQASRQIAASVAQTKQDDRHNQKALQNTLNTIQNQGRQSRRQIAASVNRFGNSTDQQLQQLARNSNRQAGASHQVASSVTQLIKENGLQFQQQIAVTQDTKTAVNQAAKATTQQLQQQASSIKQQTAVTTQIAKSNEKFQEAQMRVFQKTNAQLVADRRNLLAATKATETANKKRDAENLAAIKQSLKQSDTKRQADQKAIEAKLSKLKLSPNEPRGAKSLPRGPANHQGPKNEVSAGKVSVKKGISADPHHRVGSAVQANSHVSWNGEASSYHSGSSFGGNHQNQVDWQNLSTPQNLTKSQNPAHDQAPPSEETPSYPASWEQPQKHSPSTLSDGGSEAHHPFQGIRYELSPINATFPGELFRSSPTETAWPYNQPWNGRDHDQETYNGYTQNYGMTQNEYEDFQRQQGSQSNGWYHETRGNSEANQPWDGGDHDHGADNGYIQGHGMTQNGYGDFQRQQGSQSNGWYHEAGDDVEANQTHGGEQYEDLGYTGQADINEYLGGHEGDEAHEDSSDGVDENSSDEVHENSSDEADEDLGGHEDYGDYEGEKVCEDYVDDEDHENYDGHSYY
ncbi:hypothetical protein BDZ45DRAFT_731352 [Acephala macrosclerotiorum]|nr:hypothetical protein BDZ45DRAFT_731352 [Acephala macrosclerotiorum]